MLDKLKGRNAWIAPVLWGSFILILTSIPKFKPSGIFLFENADKILHMGAYAPLGFFLMHAFKENKLGNRSPVQYTYFSGAIFGLFDEIHQIFIPGRYFDLADWLADAIGILIGCFTYMLYRHFVMNKTLINE